MEKLAVSSGTVLIIDQFMLANEQFLASHAGASGDGKDQVVRRYGGCLVQLPAGSYCVQRDSQLQLLAVRAADGSESKDNSDDLEGLGDVFDEFGPDAAPLCNVLVDTRCLVFADADILADDAVLQEYRELRGKDDFKSARDLLRGSGAAVRYGFNRYGDELGLYQREGLVALWPH